MTHGLRKGDEINWFKKFFTGKTGAGIPRKEYLEVLGKIIEKNWECQRVLFQHEMVVCQLIQKSRELYDMAFLIETYIKLKGLNEIPLNLVD